MKIEIERLKDLKHGDIFEDEDEKIVVLETEKAFPNSSEINLLPFYVLARFKSNNQLEIAKEMEFIDIEELRLEIMFEFEATEFK